MVYDYQFAVAVVIPSPGLVEECVKEYLGSVAEESYDSYAVVVNEGRAGRVSLARLLSGEDLPLGNLVAASFEVASEEEEAFLAGQMHKVPARNFVVANSPRPYLWDWPWRRRRFSLIYFIGTPLEEAYLEQGLLLLRFDPAGDCPVFDPFRC